MSVKNKKCRSKIEKVSQKSKMSVKNQKYRSKIKSFGQKSKNWNFGQNQNFSNFWSNLELQDPKKSAFQTTYPMRVCIFWVSKKTSRIIAILIYTISTYLYSTKLTKKVKNSQNQIIFFQVPLCHFGQFDIYDLFFV